MEHKDLQHAKTLLQDGGYTCVLCRGDAVYTSRQRGIQPLMNWIEEGTDLHGFCAADRIVGRAAAFLYCKAGVCAVYAAVLTVGARSLLMHSGIEVQWGELTDGIINRTGTGLCPMEQAVRDALTPEQAFDAIRKKLQK